MSPQHNNTFVSLLVNLNISSLIKNKKQKFEFFFSVQAGMSVIVMMCKKKEEDYFQEINDELVVEQE